MTHLKTQSLLRLSAKSSRKQSESWTEFIPAGLAGRHMKPRDKPQGAVQRLSQVQFYLVLLLQSI